MKLIYFWLHFPLIAVFGIWLYFDHLAAGVRAPSNPVAKAAPKPSR
jgi:hypothetical protein